MFARELLPGIRAIRNLHHRTCVESRPDLLQKLDEAETAALDDDPVLATEIIDRLYPPYARLELAEVLSIIICLCNGRPEEIAA